MRLSPILSELSEPPKEGTHPFLLAMYAATHPEILHDGNAHPVNSAPPPAAQMPTQRTNRAAERLVNAGVSLTDFKAMSQADQQTLLQQLAQEEQQAMVQGFDAAKLGFDVAKL